MVLEKNGDMSLYHHYNNLGSTMKLTDAKGNVKATYTYGTYGELLSGDASLTRFLYNGRCGVTTDDNGLYYMRQRYYSPDIKRFLNQDILTGSLDNSQSLNRYSYVQGNPVSYTDPFGLSPLNGLFGAMYVGYTVLHLLAKEMTTGTNPLHIALGIVTVACGGWVGLAATAIDGLIYFFVDGETFEAGMCALGTALPITMRMGANFLKCATSAARVMQTANVIENGVTFFRNAKPTIENAFFMWNEYVLQGKAFGPEGYVQGILTGISAIGTVIAGKNAWASAKGLASITGNLCFVAGTQIVTEDGSKNIEDIEIGDLVYSKDTLSGETGYKKVVQVFCNETTELLHVQIGDEIITTTPKHPFWVEGYGFKEAALLETGDLVETTEGELLPVSGVWLEYLDEPVLVYNFEVEDWHTYYVSEIGIWVHNAEGCVEKLAGSNKNHVNGSIAEIQGYQDALNKGEIGIQRPGKVTAAGPDYITYNPSSETVNVWDSKISWNIFKWPQ